MNRQRLTLFLLLIILAVAALISYFLMPSSQKTESPKLDGKASVVSGSATKNNNSKADDRILKLELLNKGQAAFSGYRRNIFRPIFIDDDKLLQQKAAAIKKSTPPPVQVIIPPEDPVERRKKQLRADLARIVFKGFLSKNSKKIVFLSRGDTIFLVKQGEIFDSRFKLVSIADQYVTVQISETAEEIAIPLIESAPLK